MKNTYTDICWFLAMFLIVAAYLRGDEPGPLFTVSTPTTMTDDELRKEFLRHTHAHTHKDFEAQITRLGERVDELTDMVNTLMRIVVHLDRKLEVLSARAGASTSHRPIRAATPTRAPEPILVPAEEETRP